MWKSLTGKTHRRAKIRVQDGDMAFVLPQYIAGIVARNARDVQNAVDMHSQLQEAERIDRRMRK